jgi:hypothetical protein
MNRYELLAMKEPEPSIIEKFDFRKILSPSDGLLNIRILDYKPLPYEAPFKHFHSIAPCESDCPLCQLHGTK